MSLGPRSFLTFDEGLDLEAARSSIRVDREMGAFAFVSRFIVVFCIHNNGELVRECTKMGGNDC
jgi:hypothetical protein